jgi:hypothetical protein
MVYILLVAFCLRHGLALFPGGSKSSSKRRLWKMRRLTAVFFCVGLICASAFLSYAATAGSADKTPPAAGAASAAKVTRMRAAGVVTEITVTMLKIERKVKDTVETMEFALEKPVAKIKAGDKVKVSYITKDAKNIATRVTEDVPPKPVKKLNKAEDKPATPAAAAPARK